MASYTDTEREELQQVPIEDVLKVFGRSTAHGQDNLFLSPFRDEKVPSFHISRDGRKWYDFGTGEGGTVLTLVCKLLGCDGGKAYDFLASVSNTFIPSSPEDSKKDYCPEDRGRINVTDVRRPFSDKSLIGYAASRGITAATLNRYCREVVFSFEGHPGFRNNAIGFQNNRGGWIMRAPDVKRCSSSDITTINIYGERSASSTSPTGIIFEGFFDFLSMMEISGSEWPKCDVCILNSVTNIRKAQDWVFAHKEICTFFDNDAAGRKALQDLQPSTCVKVNDWSCLYEGFKDLGERLERCTKNARERELFTIQYQSLWNKTFQKKFRTD